MGHRGMPCAHHGGVDAQSAGLCKRPEREADAQAHGHTADTSNGRADEGGKHDSDDRADHQYRCLTHEGTHTDNGRPSNSPTRRPPTMAANGTKRVCVA